MFRYLRPAPAVSGADFQRLSTSAFPKQVICAAFIIFVLILRLLRELAELQEQVIVSSRHPAARQAMDMDMDTYLSLSHVLASPEGQRHGLVDAALAQQGKQRRLALTLMSRRPSSPTMGMFSRSNASILTTMAHESAWKTFALCRGLTLPTNIKGPWKTWARLFREVAKRMLDAWGQGIEDIKPDAKPGK